MSAGSADEAEGLLLRAHATLVTDPGAVEAARFAAASLAELYDRSKRPTDAAGWRDRARSR